MTNNVSTCFKHLRQQKVWFSEKELLFYRNSLLTTRDETVEYCVFENYKAFKLLDFSDYCANMSKNRPLIR